MLTPTSGGTEWDGEERSSRGIAPRSMPHLELERRQVTQCRVPAAPVVEAFDVGEDRKLGFIARRPRPTVEELGLERGHERLCGGVVVGISDRSHRRNDAGLLQTTTEGQARVLRSVVGMVDQAMRWPTVVNRHVERVEHQLGAEVSRHRPPDDPVREQIEDERE